VTTVEYRSFSGGAAAATDKAREKIASQNKFLQGISDRSAFVFI